MYSHSSLKPNAKSSAHLSKHVMKHLLPTFVLWLISKRPLHGYEIIKMLESASGLRMLDANKLYPLLKSLTRQGLVSHEMKMTGKRARKTYRITAKGREMLARAKECIANNTLKREFLKEMVA